MGCGCAKKSCVPREIKRLGNEGIEITWDDGTVSKLSSETLRKNCPSATSRAARGDTSHDTPLTSKPSSLRIVESTKSEELRLEQIWGVGNYALGMSWGDGHKTGIYPYSLLRELAGSGPCAQP